MPISLADTIPTRSAFTRAERRVIDQLRTPRAVQRYLNGLTYNTEPPPGGPQQRTFRSVVAAGTAHCLEAALTAAGILEQPARGIRGRSAACCPDRLSPK